MKRNLWLAAAAAAILLLMPMALFAQQSGLRAYTVTGRPGMSVVCDRDNNNCRLAHTAGAIEMGEEGQTTLEAGYRNGVIVLPPPPPTLSVGMAHDLAVTPLPPEAVRLCDMRPDWCTER